mmetsp:Transcript_2406/g.3064  ORF Transcript_2406/g.3064 Transcript_2406/m.3064 type:complete len:88 (+) Transcript_2406:2390-2653(+)
MLAKEIERLEKEANLVDAKLTTMTIKERAEWDKHYPFSIREHDAAKQEIEDKHRTSRKIRKLLEENELLGDENAKFDFEEIDQLAAA